MRVAVAGARGFIGAHLCETLEAAGHAVERFGSEGPGAVEGAVDALVWLGGNASERVDDGRLRQMHVKAPMLSLARLAPRHVLYVSSGEVYGQGRIPFRERDVAAPLTAYGKAKLAGEHAVSSWCAHSGITRTILRPAVVYGPRQVGRMLIPSALQALSDGARFPTTQGTQTRDFISVHDVVELMKICLELGENGVFNAGSGEERSVGSVLSTLAHCIGNDADGLLDFGAVERRTGEAERYVLDVTAAERALGWHPTIELAAGFAELVESHALRK